MKVRIRQRPPISDCRLCLLLWLQCKIVALVFCVAVFLPRTPDLARSFFPFLLTDASSLWLTHFHHNSLSREILVCGTVCSFPSNLISPGKPNLQLVNKPAHSCSQGTVPNFVPSSFEICPPGQRPCQSPHFICVDNGKGRDALLGFLRVAPVLAPECRRKDRVFCYDSNRRSGNSINQ